MEYCIRRSQLAVGAAKLFKQHGAESGIGFVDADGVHKFLDVVIHEKAPGAGVEWPASPALDGQIRTAT